MLSYMSVWSLGCGRSRKPKELEESYKYVEHASEDHGQGVHHGHSGVSLRASPLSHKLP
jgi:hypothetical protein